MKKFITGIILDTDEAEDIKNIDGDINYNDAAFGDYIVHALFDITDAEHPIMVILEDNIHHPVESEIKSFFYALNYCKMPYELTNEVIFVTEGNPYDTDYSKLSILVKGSTKTCNLKDNINEI